MGNKYIIEIEESYAPVKRRGAELEVSRLYRAKGFNSLVFDEKGLNKLEMYDPEKEYDRGYEQGFEAGQHEATSIEFENGYKKGLNDAWEAAKNFYEDMFSGDTEQKDVLLKYRVKINNAALLKTRIKAVWGKDVGKSFFNAGPEYAIESLHLWKENEKNTCRG